MKTPIPTATQSDRRQHTRNQVSLDCTLHADNFEISGRVVDISEGGAGIRLFFETAEGLSAGINSITIDTIGKIPATLRWKSADRLGVSFDRNPEVVAFLKANGPSQEM
ncbi:PilZ domain-containing protein [Roseobacter weihaiensis]|uniref:PilZ domain-containing protein n=1 Tax=Roseobacter weihaiensis TaxID=2763262 RepID=UPI001D09F361|nr:PilZ domain-containing protein [Roseobacter sp. H9]